MRSHWKTIFLCFYRKCHCSVSVLGSFVRSHPPSFLLFLTARDSVLDSFKFLPFLAVIFLKIFFFLNLFVNEKLKIRITFKRIIKNKSTEQFSGIPYPMTLLNCLLSAWLKPSLQILTSVSLTTLFLSFLCFFQVRTSLCVKGQHACEHNQRNRSLDRNSLRVDLPFLRAKEGES